jgi:thiamine kinase-like enzyme
MYSIDAGLAICPFDAPIRIPLTMGTGSPIVKVINREGTFVDRGFDSLLSPSEIRDELRITLWAGQHNIAPTVHFSDTTHIIMDWIDGKHIQELSLDQIANLAAIFRNMHSLPPPENISLPKRSRFADKFFDVYSQMEQQTLIPSYLSAIKSKLLEDTNHAENLVLCHGDVHANNLLWTKDNIFLIDWTCAGLDYPIVDLCVVSMFWNFTETQEEHLLNSYFGAVPDAACIRKFATFKNYARIGWGMWPIMRILADFPEKIKDLGNILETRFKTPTRRSFEEYRIALFRGSFNTLVREFDDWIDLHLARIQASNL